MRSFGNDIRLAFRSLRKNPVLTIVALVSLGIGIGANTAIFTLMDRLVLRALPVRNPEQLVLFAAGGGRAGSIETSYNDALTFSWPKYRHLREQSRLVFQDLIARFPFDAAISWEAGTERAQGEMVSSNYFAVLAVEPAMGRLIVDDDARDAGGNPVVVLSYGYWMRRFGGRRDILNRSLIVNGRPLTIVGVAQRGFQSVGAGEAPGIFVPITMVGAMKPRWDALEQPHTYWLNVFGRLKPGVSREQAESAMSVVWSRILANDAATLPAARALGREKYLQGKLEVVDGSNGISAIRGDFAEALYLLMGIVGLVLLIACANVANLLLGRAAARNKELAIRVSLGAGRGRLIRQLLAECGVLALGGGVAGLLIASWTGPLLLRLVPEGIPLAGITDDPDGRVLLFTLCLSVWTGLLFGCVPALRASRPDLAAVLKEQLASNSGAGHARIRKVLVAGQIAVSMLLLGTAGMCAHSLYNLSTLNPGFRTDHTVTFSVDPQLSGYTEERSLRLFTGLRGALATAPGVSGVSMAKWPLVTDSISISTYRIEGYEEESSQYKSLNQNRVGPGFFSLMGIPLMAGREFHDSDETGAPLVAVINDSFARKFFSGRNPIGMHLTTRGTPPVQYEIVGVVKDAKYDDLREEPKPFAYFPAAQDSRPGPMTFYVRTAALPEVLAPALRQTVRSLDANLPVEGPRTLRGQIMESVFLDRMVAALAGAFAGLATVLAAVGLFGVIVWTVTRRKREIGIRMALGAGPAEVLRMVMSEVLWLGVAGIALAVPVWFAAARLLGSALFHVKGNDPLSLAGAVIVLGLVGGVAGFIPAFRASRIDPNSAIRSG